MKSKFTHKWIYYALSICIATLAVFESPRLFFLLMLLLVFLIYKKERWIHMILLIVSSIITFYYVTDKVNFLQKPFSLPTTLTWTEEYKITGDTLRGFMNDEEGRKIYVTYELPSEKEKEQLQSIPLVGKRFFIEGKLVEGKGRNHPFAFSMEQYLKNKGSIGIVEISSWKEITSTPTFIETIAKIRFYLKKHIENQFPSSLVAEAHALLIGYRESTDYETERTYQRFGITHLFAISGLHVAIVSAIIYEGLLRLHVRKQLALVVLIILLPLYGMIAGGAPSVWRAVSVVELIAISQWFRKLTLDDAISISLILFVVLNPFVIYEIGFQLSYLATYSLVYSSTIIDRFTTWWSKSFIITFICQLGVYPLLLFHFYEISVSSFLLNVLFVPLFSFIILPVTIILLLLSFLPLPIAEGIFYIYEPLRMFLSQMMIRLNEVPYQMWIIGKPSTLIIIITYVGVFFTFYFIDVGARVWKIIFSLFVPIVILQGQSNLFHELKISFIDVGQGDSILIELPYQREVYLIDTGGVLRFYEEEWKRSDTPFEVGRQIVVPYLKGKGIHKLDKLILTHADSDHVEGAEEILKEIKVEEIHITPDSLHKEVMGDLIREAKKRNIPIKEQMSGIYWKMDDVLFQYISPFDTTYEGNNDSLVLYMKKGDFEALFTGDLEKDGEQKILQTYPDLKNIDLLKAGHHGSNTSSGEDFVKQLKPNLTIFCAGENNRYGHPHKEVLERFDLMQLQTLSTSEVGTIEVKIGEKVNISIYDSLSN